MVTRWKEQFYFVGASWFAFWAKLVLKRWRPKIVVVTGSAGKTTVFWLLHAQLAAQAEFAFDANSAYGIPFDLLQFKRHDYNWGEWLKMFVLAPWRGLTVKREKKIYIVEADADRPGEGSFTARLLQTDYTIITNIYQTHARRYDRLVARGQYAQVQDAIAAEFNQFALLTKQKVWIDSDNQVLMSTVTQAQDRGEIKAEVIFLQQADFLLDYKILTNSTQFVIRDETYQLPYLLPPVIWFGLVVSQQLAAEFGVRLDTTYSQLSLPGGRSNLLAGYHQTTLIDSSYNANLGSMRVILDLFEQYPATGPKWIVLGQMLEQGEQAEAQHYQLALKLASLQTIDRFFLIGENSRQWVYPTLARRWANEPEKVQFFADPSVALTTIKQAITGGETILLKGAPMMEGMVEGLLANPDDAAKLVRREAVFAQERAQLYHLDQSSQQSQNGTKKDLLGPVIKQQPKTNLES